MFLKVVQFKNQLLFLSIATLIYNNFIKFSFHLFLKCGCLYMRFSSPSLSAALISNSCSSSSLSILDCQRGQGDSKSWPLSAGPAFFSLFRRYFKIKHWKLLSISCSWNYNSKRNLKAVFSSLCVDIFSCISRPCVIHLEYLFAFSQSSGTQKGFNKGVYYLFLW